MDRQQRQHREHELARRMRTGDDEDRERAREEFVSLNVGLVHHLVRRMRIPPMDEPDAVQDGLCGLLRAMDGFDPARGMFAAYASPWIIAAVQDGQARHQDVGVRAIRRRSSIRRAHQQLAQRNGREPSPAEVALAVGQSVALVQQALRPVEFVPLGDVDIPQYEAGFDEVDGPEVEVSALLEHVCAEDRRVICARFGLDGRGGKPLGRIAEEEGLSVYQVRRRIARGLAVMRGGAELQRAA